MATAGCCGGVGIIKFVYDIELRGSTTIYYEEMRWNLQPLMELGL